MEINNGQVFIVTGAASGLGEGTARMLAAAGAKVLLADLQVERGEAVAQEIGGRFVKCDVTSETDAQAVVAAATTIGRLSGLVTYTPAWQAGLALPAPRVCRSIRHSACDPHHIFP